MVSASHLSPSSYSPISSSTPPLTVPSSFYQQQQDGGGPSTTTTTTTYMPPHASSSGGGGGGVPSAGDYNSYAVDGGAQQHPPIPPTTTQQQHAYNNYATPSSSLAHAHQHHQHHQQPTFAFDPTSYSAATTTGGVQPASSSSAYSNMYGYAAAPSTTMDGAATNFASSMRQQQAPPPQQLQRLSLASTTDSSGSDAAYNGYSAGGIDNRASFSSSNSGEMGEYGSYAATSAGARTMPPWSAYSSAGTYPGINSGGLVGGGGHSGFLPLGTGVGVGGIGGALAGALPLRQRQSRRGGWSMEVKQQPERARLCSFKEENDTIDRRPVDPPPIVQIYADYPSASAILEDTHLFVRVSLVAKLSSNDPMSIPSDHDPSLPYYPEVRLPQGTAATTGEALQTPEKLLDLEGKEGVFCVFGKLSIRMPGVFRLRFVVYNTVDSVFPGDGVEELASCISEPFEVFSPKLFNGMKPSTTLTRHFASQGFKIKLRQSSGYGKTATTAAKKRKKEDSGGSAATGGGAGGSGSSKSRRRMSDVAHMTTGDSSISGEPYQTSPVSAMHSTFGASPHARRYTEPEPPAYQPMFRPHHQSDFHPAPLLDTGQPPPQAPPAASSSSHGRSGGGSISLPPIAAAVEQSSVWFRRAGLIHDSPPDAAGHEGGREFRDGIRYGGDDGFMPPMSFGKLPNMIYEGLLPTTPGPSNMFPPTDLSGFSLKINGGAAPPATMTMPLKAGESLSSSSSASPFGNNNKSTTIRQLPPPATITSQDAHRRPSVSALRSGRADSEDSSSPGMSRGNANRLSLPADPAVSAAYRFSSALVSARNSDDAPHFELKMPRRVSRTDSLQSQSQSPNDEYRVNSNTMKESSSSSARPPVYEADDTMKREAVDQERSTTTAIALA